MRPVKRLACSRLRLRLPRWQRSSQVLVSMPRQQMLALCWLPTPLQPPRLRSLLRQVWRCFRRLLVETTQQTRFQAREFDAE